MFRNFKTVDHIVFGRGSFNQLDDILVSRRTANRSAMVFVVDDAFAEAPLRERVPLQEADLMLWVNVDDEPKTRYVDKLTDQVP